MRASGARGGRGGLTGPGAELDRALPGEKQPAHPWKWVISASQKRDTETPVKTSEIVFKNTSPFPACVLGGRWGLPSGFASFAVPTAFPEVPFCRGTDSADRHVLILGDLGLFLVWMWLWRYCGSCVSITDSCWPWRAPPEEKLQAVRRRGPVATSSLRDEPRASANGPGAGTHSGTGAALSIP